jgi:hypothetical protein
MFETVQLGKAYGNDVERMVGSLWQFEKEKDSPLVVSFSICGGMNISQQHMTVDEAIDFASMLVSSIYAIHPRKMTLALEKKLDCALYFVEDDADSEV